MFLKKYFKKSKFKKEDRIDYHPRYSKMPEYYELSEAEKSYLFMKYDIRNEEDYIRQKAKLSINEVGNFKESEQE